MNNQVSLVPSFSETKNSSFQNNKHMYVISCHAESNKQKFIVPKNVSIIFFTKHDDCLGSYSCDFENVIVDAKYEYVNKYFNIPVFNNEQTQTISEKNGSILSDIEYYRYDEDMECYDISCDLNNNTVKYDNNSNMQNNNSNIFEDFEYVMKVGVFKYPLNLRNLYKNKCYNSDGTYEFKYGFSTSTPYLIEQIDESDMLNEQYHNYDKKINDYINRTNLKDEQYIEIIRKNLKNDIKNHTNYVNAINKSYMDSIFERTNINLSKICKKIQKKHQQPDCHIIILVLACRA